MNCSVVIVVVCYFVAVVGHAAAAVDGRVVDAAVVMLLAVTLMLSASAFPALLFHRVPRLETNKGENISLEPLNKNQVPYLYINPVSNSV